MKLYHFTSRARLVLVQAAGELRPTESNIGSPRPDWPPMGEHVGPDVVWLTDEEDCGTGRGLALDGSLDGSNKTEVRFTVEVPDADTVWWPDFAAAYGMNRSWRRTFERGREPEAWFVVARPIPQAEWVSIDVRAARPELRLPGL